MTAPHTPPPVSEERLDAPVCVECSTPMLDGGPCGWYCPSDAPHPKSDALVKEMIRANTPVPRAEYDALVTTIATLTKEHDRRGASIREYMDMCEEYSASVAELTDLLTRVRAERDVMSTNDARYRWMRSEALGVHHGRSRIEFPDIAWPTGRTLQHTADYLDAAIDAQLATPSPSQVPHE